MGSIWEDCAVAAPWACTSVPINATAITVSPKQRQADFNIIILLVERKLGGSRRLPDRLPETPRLGTGHDSP
jgi:hypothetical protein